MQNKMPKKMLKKIGIGVASFGLLSFNKTSNAWT